MPQTPDLRHLISVHDLTAAEVAGLFRLAADVKAHPETYRTAMSHKSLGMIFEKSSTRTRVSFEVGMVQMGGHALFLSSRELIEADLQKLRIDPATEEGAICIPFSHIDGWIHGLNQARIALAAAVTIEQGQAVDLSMQLRLMQHDYPIKVHGTMMTPMSGADANHPHVFYCGLAFDNVPDNEKLVIHAYVHERLPAAQRFELCHDEQRVVIRRGWTPLPDGCTPEPGDRVVALD